LTKGISMKKFVLVFFTTLLIAGCGSSVKLDNVPVEDRSATTLVQPGAGGAGASGVQKNAVASVDIEKPMQPGLVPAGSRVVYFDYDSFVIKPEFQSVVEAHARFIKSNKGRKVAIEGHTDERGGREYNLALGQKRAEAVRSALGLLGVADSQLEAVSFGKEKPAVQGSDEGAMAKNRRAEISYR
jgi:peptidoglycan-associated lipoprotein